MKQLVIIFALGAFSSIAMAPHNLYAALFIGISGLYIFLCGSPTPLKSALTGFMFSLGYFGFSLSWIGNALLVDGNPYWWAYPIAVSGLPMILSLFTAVFCYIYKVICKSTNGLASYIIFVILLTLSEYARGHLFTGFPWNLYGYTWIEVMPIAQIAALWDIYLLTTLTIFWASAPAFILTSKYTNKIKVVFSILISASFIFSYIFGVMRIENHPPEPSPDYEVIIIQPNIKQSEKWNIDKRSDNFIKQIELSKYNPSKNSAQKKAYYIIWSETAISQDLLNSKWVVDTISNMLKDYPNNAYLIAGALRYDREIKSYFNSIITFNNKGEIIHIYDKSHLVPFGEYMPFENIFDIAPIVGFTGFEKGAGRVTFEMPEDIKFSPLICYEVIFPRKVINTSNKPDFIVNVTNDAWYEGSAGPHQHLVQARFRAIETGIPLFRSANTGISAIITPLGYVYSYAKQSIETSLISTIYKL